MLFFNLKLNVSVQPNLKGLGLPLRGGHSTRVYQAADCEELCARGGQFVVSVFTVLSHSMLRCWCPPKGLSSLIKALTELNPLGQTTHCQGLN